MTPEEHKARHVELHRALDELIADWIGSTTKLPSTSTVLELMEWSHGQTLATDPIPEEVASRPEASEQP